MAHPIPMAARNSPLKAALSVLAAVFALALVLGMTSSLAWAAKVTYLKPPAQIKRQGAREWRPLKLEDAVQTGDRLRTGFGGRVEVTLGSKRVFRIGEATEIAMPELEDPQGTRTRSRFHLLLGRFWAGLIRPLARRANTTFQVSTPMATIGVKGTRFGMDHDRNRNTSRVLVLEGAVAVVPPGGEKQLVEVEGPREIAPPQEITEEEWLLLVEREQKVIIRPGEVPRLEPITPEDRADEWVRFNSQRDQALAQSP